MNKFLIIVFSLCLCLQGMAQESSYVVADVSYKRLMHKIEVKNETKKRLKKYAGIAIFLVLVVVGALVGAHKKKDKNKSSDSVGLFVDLGMKTDSKKHNPKR